MAAILFDFFNTKAYMNLTVAQLTNKNISASPKNISHTAF